MFKNLALVVLIAFASIGVAVAASAVFEWWQDRGVAAPRAVVAPVDATTLATTTTAESLREDAALEAEMEARLLAEMAAEERTVAVLAAEELAYQQVHQPVTTTTLHPQVQAQGLERVVTIIERHSDAWPWVVPALDVAQLSFFEDLPAVCDSAIGCYNHTTGDIWLSLDALRERDTTSLSFFFDDRGPSDIVLHELAHAYTRSFQQGSDLLDLFGQHYAGCSGYGLDADRFVGELLADAMAMAATRAGSSLPNDYGYFRSGGFTGCLVESSKPDITLFRAVYSALFNCDSEHALNVYEDHHYPDLLSFSFSRDADAEAVLHTCYDTEDHRDDYAEQRLHERRCADGLVRSVIGSPRAGWEFGCEDFVTEQAVFLPACDQHSSACTIFVPADVECTVVTDYDRQILPGLLAVSGECIVPICTAGGLQGERLPGYLEHGWGKCIAIDRPENDMELTRFG